MLIESALVLVVLLSTQVYKRWLSCVWRGNTNTVDFHVFRQVGNISTHKRTQSTFMRLFTSMHDQMRVQSMFLGEGDITQIALIGLLPRVFSLMNGQVVRLERIIITICTLIKFTTGMSQHMLGQAIRSRKPLGTNPTHMSFRLGGVLTMRLFVNCEIYNIWTLEIT